jgi:O-antigen/teichoic acid export membrane protein
LNNQEKTFNSKRVAKNTLVLYLRQILILLVSLYTVRIILNTLGAKDYGIYNVVAGVVTMFNFLTNSLASSFQRFLTYEIAQKNEHRLKETFGVGISIHLILALIILAIAETVGFQFLKLKLVIPETRMLAAVWVYRTSMLSFLMMMLMAPFQAMCIAQENMNIYAYASMIEVILKLIVVFCLQLFLADKLIVYAKLSLLIPIANILMYSAFCLKHYPACRTLLHWDKSLFRTILFYTSWNFLGTLSRVFKDQGVNILLNMFFGPLINAARAIAFQVNNSLSSFSLNFSVALRPQIIKTYTSGEKETSFSLVFRGSKYCFFLLYFLSLPILLQTDYVLSTWLKDVPDYTVLFTQLVIIDALINSISHPLIALMHAMGKIMKYQIVVSGITLLNLPVSYMLLKANFPPQTTMIISIALSSAALYLRLLMLKNQTGISAIKFFSYALKPIGIVSLCALLSPLIIVRNIGEPNLYIFLLVGFISSVSVILFVFWAGMDIEEKRFIKTKLAYMLKRLPGGTPIG